MTARRNTALVLFMVACVAAVLLVPRCEKKETKFPDGNIQLKKEIEAKTTETKAIQALQDTTAREAKEVIRKSIERPRVAKLLPKREVIKKDTIKGIKTNDSTTIFLNAKYDSVRHELLYKELLNDSLLELTNRLLTQGLAERKIHLEKDSLNHELVVNLNGSIDSLGAENKKLAKKVRRNWQVAKAAFGIGFAGGSIVGIAVSK